MKKNKRDVEMRENYDRKDLGSGVRKKYYNQYIEAHNIMLLNPEIVKVFPSEKAVNEALLSLIKVARASVERADKH